MHLLIYQKTIGLCFYGFGTSQDMKDNTEVLLEIRKVKDGQFNGHLKLKIKSDIAKKYVDEGEAECIVISPSSPTN
jgi:hypothetical protein